MYTLYITDQKSQNEIKSLYPYFSLSDGRRCKYRNIENRQYLRYIFDFSLQFIYRKKQTLIIIFVFIIVVCENHLFRFSFDRFSDKLNTFIRGAFNKCSD